MDDICQPTGNPAEGLRIDPRCRWVDTGTDVTVGQTLRFEATGRWIDLWIRTGPNGFGFNPAGIFGRRRCPQFRWLALLGAVDRDLSGAFLIGDRREQPFSRAGRLFVFANDHDSDFADGNNRGHVTLKIT